MHFVFCKHNSSSVIVYIAFKLGLFSFRGGTTYAIYGTRLNTAQKRHLVFYREYSDEGEERQRRQSSNPPPSSPQTSSSPISFLSSLEEGEITQCRETWDIISEVSWVWSCRHSPTYLRSSLVCINRNYLLESSKSRKKKCCYYSAKVC